MLLFAAVQARPADLRAVTVELEDDHYFLTSEAWLDATQEEVYRVLTDYKLFVKISSGFVASERIRNRPATVIPASIRGCRAVCWSSVNRSNDTVT